MIERQPTPEMLAQAEEALRAEERERKAQVVQDGLDGADAVTDVVGMTLDGTLGAIGDGIAAVAEGTVNLIGGILGGLGDL